MKEKKMMLDEMLDGAVEALYDMVMQALCALCPEDTPERREQVGQYLQVEHNGQPVAGTFLADYADLDFTGLWYTEGKSYTVMHFTFDQPVELKEGDNLTMRLGLPQE